MMNPDNAFMDRLINNTHFLSRVRRKSSLLAICLAPSFCFLGMFLLLEMYWLAAGCSLLLTLFYAFFRQAHARSYKAVLYGLLIYAFLLELVSAYFLEWEMGFQNYLFALIPLGFIFLYLTNNYCDMFMTGILSSALIMLCFLCCNVIDYLVKPVSGASRILIRAISEINSVLIIFILVSCLLLFVIELYAAHRKLIEETNRQLDGLRGSMMLSQIKPHFLYNSLGAIGETIDTDPARAKRAMECFARYMRLNIDSIANNELIPFEKELSHIDAYIQIQNLRFEDAIVMDYQLDCKDFMLPPLTIQPLVENAFKHGIRPNGGCGTIQLSVLTCFDSYRISVADDGVGVDLDNYRKSSGSTGLSNIDYRLKTLCNGHMEIASKPGCGTTVTVVIPKA